MKFLLTRVTYGISAGVGMLVYVALRGNSWAGEVAIAVAYTSLLAGLVFADEEARSHVGERLEGSALWKGIAIHLVFLFVVMLTERFVRHPSADMPAWMLARHGRQGPLLWLFATGVVIGACHIEKSMLFSGVSKQERDEAAEELPRPGDYGNFQQTGSPGEQVFSSSPEDVHAAWIRYLSQPQREFRKPGISVTAEHELWTVARLRSQAEVMAAS